MSDFFLLSQTFSTALKERLLKFCPHAQVSRLAKGSRTSPLGTQADDLEKQLTISVRLRRLHGVVSRNLGLVEPETLDTEERKLIAYREAVSRLQEIIPELLVSIDKDPQTLSIESNLINGGSHGIFGQNLPTSLSEVTASVNKVIKHSWRPLFITSQNLVSRINEERHCPIHLRDPDSPFRFIAGKQRNSIADNLKGGLGTALEFIETLMPVISNKLSEQNSLNEKDFFEVAYNLAPLLNQLAMIHISFISNREKVQNVLYKDPALKLNLAEKQLYYDSQNAPEAPKYAEAAFNNGFSEFKSTARSFNETPTLPFTIGCPAHYVRIPTQNIPQRILPPEFKTRKSINLIELLLFQYLHLLKFEIGDRFNEITHTEEVKPASTVVNKLWSQTLSMLLKRGEGI